ncbi:MAG TPA: insulinase family protein, partial [Thermoanaerobaculia bacterium]|nr:insulinase family protein [Thermoanaerobaculia bacterium]
GAIEPPRFLARLAALWKARRHRESSGASALPPRGRRPTGRRSALYLARPDLTQSHLLVGGATLAYGHRLVPAASLATIVLGGGVSSRLWRDVREKRGLAYHVGTSLTLHKSAGLSLIEAATAPKNLPKLVKTTGRVLARLLEDGVTRAELSRAKDQVRAEVALSLESTVARREAGARAWLYRGRPHEADEVIAEIDAVTGADVLEACRLLFGDRKALALGVSGPDVKGPSVDELREELAA